MRLQRGLVLSVVFFAGACAQDGLNAIPEPPFVPQEEEPLSTPIAVADFRQGFSEAGSIAPLDRVHLDGRAMGTTSSTHDPRDPSDTTLITDYVWKVTQAPEGVNPDDFQFQGQGTGLFSFFLPLAGTYEVSLTVTNDQEIDSVATTAARVTINAIPSQRFLVELTWDDNDNDQDLHLVNTAISETLCSDDDCYFSNMTPIWFSADAEGEGANPTLDIDDMDGLGPENINIDAPRPSTYRIYVHYYDAFGDATTNTIKIWVDGVVAQTYSRRMYPEEVWTVAEVDWEAAGVAIITPYPSDATGQVGEIGDMSDEDCFGGGWDDWF